MSVGKEFQIFGRAETLSSCMSSGYDVIVKKVLCQDEFAFSRGKTCLSVGKTHVNMQNVVPIVFAVMTVGKRYWRLFLV